MQDSFDLFILFCYFYYKNVSVLLNRYEYWVYVFIFI